MDQRKIVWGRDCIDSEYLSEIIRDNCCFYITVHILTFLFLGISANSLFQRLCMFRVTIIKYRDEHLTHILVSDGGF